MQKILVLGLGLLVASVTSAYAEPVPLKREGGIYIIPVLINDKMTLNFTVDTGAADVSIPADVFSTLLRTGTITKSDLLDTRVYVLADGSQERSQRFRIRSLRVGKLELRDVVASVAPSAGLLLLGQSFLERFTSWSFDNQRHLLILNESPTGLTGPAMEQPSESAPAQDRGPSLPVTINFVTRTVTEQGFLEFTRSSRNVKEDYAFSQAIRDSFSFDSTAKGRCSVAIQRAESRDGSQPAFWTGTIDLEAATKVELSPELEAENKYPILPTFVVTAINPSITRVTVKGRVSGNFSPAFLMFYDEDIAQRVAKALTHAIELCGGGEQEPF